MKWYKSLIVERKGESVGIFFVIRPPPAEGRNRYNDILDISIIMRSD